MYKSSRVVALLLCLLMVFSLFAGCAGNKEAASDGKSQPAKDDTANKQDEKGNDENGDVEQGAPVPFKETFEFSIMQYHRPPYDENPIVWEEMQKRTNTKIKYIKVPSSNFGEKLNVTLASGELPDIVYLRGDTELVTWIDQGAVIPLDELLKKHGQDIIMHYTEEDLARIKNPLDGKIYAVQGIIELKEINSLGVREDWLKDLGLDVPETLEEWEAVLTAFKENDPAGNGSTIPFAGWDSPIYDAYGIVRGGASGAWTITEDNRYIPFYEHPNFRECLETLNRWYENKLMDQEFMVRNKDMKAIQELFNTGQAGVGVHAANRLQLITEALQQNDPDAKMLPVKPIKGPYGHQQIAGRNRYHNRAVITVTADKAGKSEKLMQFLNWTFSDEGIELLNFGIEGEHHKKVDGKPELIPPYNQGWEAKRKDGMNPLMMAFFWSIEAYKDSLLRGKTLEELTDVERITYDGLFMNSEFIYRPIPTFDTPANREKGADIYPFLSENLTKAIMGEISIDDFFKALEQAKNDGLDQITQEMNDLYQKTQQ